MVGVLHGFCSLFGAYKGVMQKNLSKHEPKKAFDTTFGFFALVIVIVQMCRNILSVAMSYQFVAFVDTATPRSC